MGMNLLSVVCRPQVHKKSIELGPPAWRAFQKINAFLQAQTWASHVKGFFLSTGPHRPPAPPIAASLILPVMFWGQNYVLVRPYGLSFIVFFLFLYSFLIFSFCYSLLILLSFLISFYSYLLSFSSYSFRTILCLLLFLYFNLSVVLQPCRLII